MRESLKRIAALICATVALAALPALAFATETETEKDAGGNPYSTEDIAIISRIIDSTASLENYKDKPVSSWDFVYWERESDNDLTQRVWKIELENLGISGTLDVSGLDHLDTLLCGGNKDLTGLTLPTDGNRLAYLSCYNTGLTGTLDVSGYRNLEILSCDDTDITALKVAGLAKLAGLYCDGTDIAALDVSGCTSLTELSCSYPDIAALDVSGCTSLAALSIEGTKVNALDVSRCTELIDLDVEGTNITVLDVSRCAKLIELDVEGTNITALDVSANSALEELSCKGTPLEYLNVRGTSINLLDLSCLTSSQTEARISDPIKLLLPEGASLTLLETTGGMAEGVILLDGEGGAHSASLTASPDDGLHYEVLRWNGLPEGASADGLDASFTIEPADAVTVSAEFALLPEDAGEGEAATKPAIAQSGDATPLALIGAAALCAGAAALLVRRRAL